MNNVDTEEPHEERRQFVRRSQDVQLLAYRTGTIEGNMKAQGDLMNRLHDRSEELNKLLQARLFNIEVQMPKLIEVRGWIVNGGLGLLGILAVAVVALVIKV